MLLELYLTKQVSNEQILIYNDGLPEGKRPPAGTAVGIKNMYFYKNIGPNAHHD
jgi:hypothetical protein